MTSQRADTRAIDISYLELVIDPPMLAREEIIVGPIALPRPNFARGLRLRGSVLLD